MDDTSSSRRSTSTAQVLDVALLVMTCGVISLLAMQAIRGDWFPPEVSISQYGVGKYGWTLSTTLLLMALACALLLVGYYRQVAGPKWSVLLPWTIWTLALVVMAFVPTNEWPAPLTMTGKVHQGAAVLGLFFAPIGALGLAGITRRDSAKSTAARARVVAITCAGLSWLFLGLLLLTNIDIDVTGLGYRRAWSLHQTLAVVLDIVMVFALIVCLRARARTRISTSMAQRTFPATTTTTRSATQ